MGIGFYGLSVSISLTFVTVNDVGESNIARYLKRGYIKSVSVGVEPLIEDNIERDEIDFLTPDEVEKLERKELFAYARKIGVTGFCNNASNVNMRNFINDFIKEAIGSIDDEDAYSDDDGDKNTEYDEGSNLGEC